MKTVTSHQTVERQWLSKTASALATLILASLPGYAVAQERVYDIVISNAQLLNGDGEMMAQTGLIVDDGKIVGLLAENDRVPLGRLQIDTNGKTVMPGIIDTHIHIALDASMVDLESSTKFFDTTVRDNMSKFLDGGVTTVRSLSDHTDLVLELRESLKSGEVEGPRLHVVGAGLAKTDGHPSATVYGQLPYLRGEATIEITSIEEANIAIDELATKGVDAIKLFYAGAHDQSGEEPANSDHDFAADATLDPEVIEAAIARAHSHGLRALVHVEKEEYAMDALEFGADGIEHGLSGQKEPASEAFLKKLVSSGASYSGTLQVYELLLPDSLEPGKSQIKLAADAGGMIVVGTDIFGPIPIVGQTQREMELLLEAGLSPSQVIQAATGNGAKSLGIEDEVGFLNEGMVADLIIVDGNPLEDISASRNVSIVIQGGKVVRIGN